MVTTNLSANVRKLDGGITVIEISGDLTRSAEDALTQAFAEASAGDVRAVILSFTGMDYMNSSGIGLLVMLLIRARRQGQRLLAYGLAEHFRQIFELTQLNEAILIFETEADALAVAQTA